jgi:hypothetical protein
MTSSWERSQELFASASAMSCDEASHSGRADDRPGVRGTPTQIRINFVEMS